MCSGSSGGSWGLLLWLLTLISQLPLGKVFLEESWRLRGAAAWPLHKYVQSPALPKPPISQDVFLAPKMAPLMSAVLGETWAGGTGDVDVGGVCWSGASF